MHTGKKLLVGEIKDISVSGALIRCEELPSPEETLELSIEVAELSYVFALVENVRFNVDDSQGESIAYELAVRFKDMTEDERRILYNAIEQEVMKKN
jgi:hypothetical protein